MSYILNIDTSTSICSVSLSENGKLIELQELIKENSHSELLTVFIQLIKDKLPDKFEQLNAVAINSGPGSYTGLRIANATAKALAFALDLKLISINSLLSLANGILETKKATGNFLICSSLDARRMDIYTAIYNDKLEIIKETEIKTITKELFADLLKENKIYFVGNANDKIKKEIISENAIFIDDIFNSSKHMIRLTNDKFNNNEFEDIAYFEPSYFQSYY